MQFKFKYNEKEYILNEQNLEYFVNDEVNPIMDVNEEKIIEILNNSDKVDFSKAYFDLPCENCKTGLEEKKKFFDFLGFNFYIYAKDRKYVVSTLDREYEGMSYIVIINVCKHCGSYSIEIEEFEV